MNDKTFHERLMKTLNIKRHELYDLPNSGSLKNRLVYMIIGVKVFKSWRKRQNESANSHQDMLADRKIASLCDLYDEASSDQRSQLRTMVPVPLVESLLHFSWRMNIKALRQRDERCLRYAVISISIEDQKFDYRESTCLTALCYHTAHRIQGQSISVLKDIASLSSNKTRKLIESFLSISPDEGLLNRTLYVEKHTNNDIKIEVTSGAVPKE